MDRPTDDTPETRPQMSRSDMRLIATAVRGKWQVPEAVFEDVPRELYVIAMTGESDRARTTAAKVLNDMLKSNREEEAIEAKAGLQGDEAPPRIIIPGSDARP